MINEVGQESPEDCLVDGEEPGKEPPWKLNPLFCLAGCALPLEPHPPVLPEEGAVAGVDDGSTGLLRQALKSPTMFDLSR